MSRVVPAGVPMTSSGSSRNPEQTDDARHGRRRIDLVAVNAAMHRLVENADPAVVFAQLAELCVPAVCDRVEVDLLREDGTAQPSAPPSAAHTGRATATVLVPSDAGRTAGSEPVDYVARLTCSWNDHQPTPADVALIELLGRCAAGTVRQARQSGTRAAGAGFG